MLAHLDNGRVEILLAHRTHAPLAQLWARQRDEVDDLERRRQGLDDGTAENSPLRVRYQVESLGQVECSLVGHEILDNMVTLSRKRRAERRTALKQRQAVQRRRLSQSMNL